MDTREIITGYTDTGLGSIRYRSACAPVLSATGRRAFAQLLSSCLLLNLEISNLFKRKPRAPQLFETKFCLGVFLIRAVFSELLYTPTTTTTHTIPYYYCCSYYNHWSNYLLTTTTTTYIPSYSVHILLQLLLLLQ